MRKVCRCIPKPTHKPGTSETKSCTDCHLSKNKDNNAIMTQLFMQGTGLHQLHGSLLLGGWAANMACTASW